MKLLRFVIAALILLAGLAGSARAQDASGQTLSAANMAYGAKNYDQAIIDYQAVLQANPNSWQAYQGLGNCYYVKGDSATALMNYQKSLALNPNNPHLASLAQSMQAKAATSTAAAVVSSVPATTASTPTVATASTSTVTMVATPVPTAATVASTPVAAASSKPSSPMPSGSDNGKIVIQIQGGLTIPASSGLADNTSAGPAIEGLIGYAFSKDFTLGLECGVDEWSTPASNKVWGGVGGLNHVPVELVGQYNINTGSVVTPFVLLGAGVAFDYSLDNPFSNDESWINFELDPGLGVAFNVAKDFNLFVQGKVALDFAPTSGLTGELIHGPNSATSDSPILSIPVQLGVNLSL